MSHLFETNTIRPVEELASVAEKQAFAAAKQDYYHQLGCYGIINYIMIVHQHHHN